MLEEATSIELSIVMPCLNEAETLEDCILKARGFLDRSHIQGEIIVADNGSHDGSQEIARRLGAQVVNVTERGYGSALRGGIEAARGRFVVMGDADASYDFASLDGFVAKLRQGFDLVVGNRFAGGIGPGAMPWSHRYLGNPVLTGVGRLLFRSASGDFHCGLRAFRRDAFDRMGLHTTGMEFASEMIIAATLQKMRVAEVSIVLHKDGRSRPPHLRRWRDGWRHLRFMLLYSPLWLFLLPGVLLFLIGAAGSVWLIDRPRSVAGVTFDIHSLLLCGFLLVLGSEVMVFGIFTRLFAASEGFLPNQPWLETIERHLRLEHGVLAGGTLTVVGAGLLAYAVLGWREVGFGPLDPVHTMRRVIPAVVLLVLGAQVIFASFFLSILGLKRR